MRTDFVRSSTGADEESGGSKFFNWAIIVVAAGLLFATTSEFMPSQPSQPQASAHRPAAVVETVTPHKT
jgi:hypothetical protein